MECYETQDILHFKGADRLIYSSHRGHQDAGGRRMWKAIESGMIPFAPYSKGIANIKRIIEKDKVGAERIAGFGLIEVPPGGVFGPHSHPEREEIYYVLSSSGSIVVGDQEVPAKEGLTLYVSGEDTHGMKNQGDEPLVVMFITVYK